MHALDLFDAVDDGDLHYLPPSHPLPSAREIIDSDDDVFAGLTDMPGDDE